MQRLVSGRKHHFLYAAAFSGGAAILTWRYLSSSSTLHASTGINAMSTSVRQRAGGFASSWPYKPHQLMKMDDSDDKDFYLTPRFVTHIDDRCIDNLSQYYGKHLPNANQDSAARPKILDIASSWISHLPENWSPANYNVVGVGMNQAELSKNRALSKHLVVDLNRDPRGLSRLLSKEEGTYDAAICSVSIDYMTQPRELLGDLHKLLKTGATVHCAFSNRCFPTKVVSLWLDLSEDERCDLVADYFHFAGTNTDDAVRAGQLYEDIEIETILARSRQGDPLYVVRGRTR